MNIQVEISILVEKIISEFQVAGMRSARQKLRSTNSPIFGAFYSLVVTNTIVSVFRFVLSNMYIVYYDVSWFKRSSRGT